MGHFKSRYNSRLIFTIMIAMISILILPGILSAGDISGYWEGYIDVGQTKLEIMVEFEQNDEGLWIGDIDIPMQGAQDMPLGEIEMSEQDVHFIIPDVPGNPTFDGTLSDDGTVISGDMTQGGQTFPFEIVKEDPEAKAQREAELGTKIEQIRNYADSMMAVYEIPGFAFAIVYDDSVIFAEGFGYRNLGDSLPVTPHTLFAIGSTTKAFTSAALAMLVEQGKLDWDDKVIDHIPEFKLWDDYSTYHMTPIDLVTHRSGLPRHDLIWYGAEIAREEVIDRLPYLEPTYELREKWQYNNLMYVTAGYMLEQIEGISWEEFVEQNIFMPLGMDYSNFSVDESQQSDDFSMPYSLEEDTVKLIPFRNISEVGPAGSINSNLVDMCKWIRLQLGYGEFEGMRIIPEDQIEKMHRPHMIISSPKEYPEIGHSSYGLGWFINDYRGYKMVHHAGGIDGFSTLVTLFPEEGLGMVAFLNLPGKPINPIMTFYTADVMFDLEFIDWSTRLGGIDTETDEEKKEDQEPEFERVEGTKPSHKLEAYVGVYEHPGYNKIEITKEGKNLHLQFNTLESGLKHWHYDVFNIEETILEGGKINFLTSEQGDINRLSIQLELMLDNFIFEKMPGAHLSDPEFMSMLTGKYDLDGTTVTVDIRAGDKLYVTIPGQPPYELDPDKETQYRIKVLNNYYVRFVMDKDRENVEGLKFIQPNGVFEAERIESEE